MAAFAAALVEGGGSGQSKSEDDLDWQRMSGSCSHDPMTGAFNYRDVRHGKIICLKIMNGPNYQ